jgi:hypothetical protein
MLGTDYTTLPNAPAIISGGYILPGSVVVTEVRPNYVVVEGADGATAQATDADAANGLGQIGEYVTYSYVLDADTLQAIADTRLAANIRTFAASIELAADSHLRPWVDFFVGDIIYVDVANGLPAGWYRVEKLAGAFTNEADGLRFVVDVGRAVTTDEAIVADRVASILEAGLIDTDTGLPTSGVTGQESTVIIIQSDDIPAHTHVASELPDVTLGGDLSGKATDANVERVQGFEYASAPGPTATGDILVWNAAEEIVEWSTPTAPAWSQAFSIAGELEVSTGTRGFLAPYDLYITGTVASIVDAPTGSSAIFDVLVDGTSIYATTPANRPTIAATATESTVPAAVPDTTYVPAGALITIDVDAIGSTIAGADATVVVSFGADLS